MSLVLKDKIGFALAVGTGAVVLLHNASPKHQESHASMVVDAGGAVTSAEIAPPIAITNVRIVSTEGLATPPDQVVLVADGFITAIGSDVELPERVRRIDGGGRYLAPGLTDAHVHLGDDAAELLPLFVANGVTTVFNLSGNERHLELRNRIQAKELVGPTIYTAGPFVDGTVVRSAADARREVQRQKSSGFDFVKIHGDLSPEAFTALADASHDQAIPILGHAQRALPISAVLEAGQAGLSHAEDLIYTDFMALNPAALGGVATRMAEAGTWLTPSLVNFEETAAQWGEPDALIDAVERRSAQFLPSSMRREWEESNPWIGQNPTDRSRIEDMLAFHGPLIRTFHEAGVQILAGTDSGMPGLVPGFSLVDEIEALSEAGMGSEAAFAAATSSPAYFIRSWVDDAAAFGTIRVGARADLVLVETDPRYEPESLRRPTAVMLRGQWLDRTALDALLNSAISSR